MTQITQIHTKKEHLRDLRENLSSCEAWQVWHGRNAVPFGGIQHPASSAQDRASSIEYLGKHYPQIPHKRGYVGKAQIGVYAVASRTVVNETNGRQAGLARGEDVVT